MKTFKYEFKNIFKRTTLILTKFIYNTIIYKCQQNQKINI